MNFGGKRELLVSVLMIVLFGSLILFGLFLFIDPTISQWVSSQVNNFSSYIIYIYILLGVAIGVGFFFIFHEKIKNIFVNLVPKLRFLDKKILIVGAIALFALSGTTSYVVVLNQNAKKIKVETPEITLSEIEELKKAKEEADKAAKEAAATEEAVSAEEASTLSGSGGSSSGGGSGSNGSSGGNGTTGTPPNGGPSDPEDPGWVWDETPPVITNLIVNWGSYDSETGKAGDFIFDAALDKVFGDFGRTVSSPGGPKALPSWDIFATLDTPIYAPIAGEVVMFTYQASTDDYSIHIRPTFNNVWLINYDHLRNVPAGIVEGAQITAGQYIGTPGPWFSNGFFELMITHDIGEGSTGYCPYDFLSSSLKATFTSNLNTLMSDWETFKSDTNIYDEAGHVKPGCVSATAPA